MIRNMLKFSAGPDATMPLASPPFRIVTEPSVPIVVPVTTAPSWTVIRPESETVVPAMSAPISAFRRPPFTSISL